MFTTSIKRSMEMFTCYDSYDLYIICFVDFQISMSVTIPIRVKTVVPVATQVAHTIAFAQVDGQAQTAQ